MSTLTKEWLLKTIAELEEERDAVPGAVNEDAAMALAAMKLALASLEAKPIGAFHISDQQVGGTTDYIKDGEWPIDDGVIEVYAAPPVPVVPDEKPVPNPLKMYAVDAVAAIAEVRGWNAYRAAMLQGADGNIGKPLTIKLPDISSKAFWSGTGKNETFHPEIYRRWVKEAIEISCTIARVDVEVK
ncbi:MULTISPECIES: hypothetical protein [Enterobacter]|uniref:hypothetical protein n=1 Tax=Enterobacter TaxID=547 RepID=UPI000AFF862E|nr:MULTISPECIES: hypothetical protein [Enterobacter]MCU2481397.1 hypothetical protein [Enterobacter hormaechei subsp. steigerwaltii]MCC9320867.1 hypothetical protein [Enterobacter hormaechei subsp. xiangfangensis]MCC9326025.1 hypothetical protein [Enterobacter hormaechei subsp. xiangfangensis]MCC9416006.1 hypothetical protein [Enterobacter hormaechei subsp. xiangfangensis]MCC9425768.1 hypothetical protein [Enterobacter hormaechei subsp. xiangfangensis]